MVKKAVKELCKQIEENPSGWKYFNSKLTDDKGVQIDYGYSIWLHINDTVFPLSWRDERALRKAVKQWLKTASLDMAKVKSTTVKVRRFDDI